MVRLVDIRQIPESKIINKGTGIFVRLAIDEKWNPERIKNRAFINDSDLLKDIKDISDKITNEAKEKRESTLHEMINWFKVNGLHLNLSRCFMRVQYREVPQYLYQGE